MTPTYNGVLDSIVEVFGAMADWLVNAVNVVVPMFYTPETGLTFIGTVSVIALAISVAFLCLGLIQSFIKLR